MSQKSILNIRGKPARLTIFGVGAMGSLFGSRLKALANVSLFGKWTAQIETLQEHGLTVIERDGCHSRHRLQVTNRLEELPPADVVLILVKSHQTTRAARQAAQILRSDGVAITLQNGLGNLEKLAEAVGEERAALGITAQGATMQAPGRLRHAGDGPTYLALASGLQKRLKLVTELFNASGMETILVDDAKSLVWGKLAVNAGINPLTALLEVPNGALVEDELWQQIMSAAANEVAQVAAAQAIKLPFPDAAAYTAKISQLTASNHSSMWQDISRSAPTEIDAICGAVVRVAQRLKIATPVNELLWRLIKDKEAGQQTFNINKLKDLMAL